MMGPTINSFSYILVVKPCLNYFEILCHQKAFVFPSAIAMFRWKTTFLEIAIKIAINTDDTLRISKNIKELRLSNRNQELFGYEPLRNMFSLGNSWEVGELHTEWPRTDNAKVH